MKQFKILTACLFLLLLMSSAIKAQPVPVEFMLGNKYGSVNVVLTKKFSKNSRFGFFHLNTVEFNYNEEQKNSFILQDLLFVETLKNLRFAGGVAYSKGGLSPTAGLQYIYSGEKLVFLCAPRVNIENEASYDIFSFIQFKPPINNNLNLFTRIQSLNVFDASGNIKSYQWLRIGLETGGVQFGVGLNFDEFGHNPEVTTNYGLFIRKEIL